MMKIMTEFYREQLIIDMADAMVTFDWRLLDLVNNFEVPLTTLYRWMTKDLKFIDSTRYFECKHAMDRHKRERIPRGRRY